MKFLKSLWSKITKTFRGSISKNPEVEVSKTEPITEKPEVEKMTQRLMDVSSKPLTIEEKSPSVKEIKSKSVKKKEPVVKPAKKVATKSAKKEPKKK